LSSPSCPFAVITSPSISRLSYHLFRHAYRLAQFAVAIARLFDYDITPYAAHFATLHADADIAPCLYATRVRHASDAACFARFRADGAILLFMARRYLIMLTAARYSRRATACCSAVRRVEAFDTDAIAVDACYTDERAIDYLRYTCQFVVER